MRDEMSDDRDTAYGQRDTAIRAQIELAHERDAAIGKRNEAIRDRDIANKATAEAMASEEVVRIELHCIAHALIPFRKGEAYPVSSLSLIGSDAFAVAHAEVERLASDLTVVRQSLEI